MSRDGLTIADLVMPFFLFIVGMSVVLSTCKQVDAGVSKNELLKKAVVRFVKVPSTALFRFWSLA